MKLLLPPSQKIYFASDFHLGSPDRSASRLRERHLVHWLEMVRKDAAHLFLMGDVFDFWFEYRRVVPKGFVRFLGKLAELSDEGIGITVFTGNHDMWMFGYLAEELGIQVRRKPATYQIGARLFYLAHGDGLGSGDWVYKTLKKIFESPFFHKIFYALHPDISFWIASQWSAHSRNSHKEEASDFRAEGEWLWQHAKTVELRQHHDYYVFGHRHLPLDLPISPQSRYLNLGEWLNYYTYAVFDGEQMALQTFDVTNI